MKKALSLSYFLIGFSFTFLLYNKIVFGLCLLLGITSLFVLDKNFKIRFKFNDLEIDSFFFLTIIFFLISSCFSIKPERSILVTIYFISFVIISLNLFFLLIKNEESYKKILNFFIISTLVNILIIFLYNLYQSGILFGDFQIFEVNFEIKKFKGTLNIISVLAILLPFFKKSKIFFVPILFIIPSLYFSNSNAPILGFLLGLFSVFFYRIIRNFNFGKLNIIVASLIFLVCISLFSKQLPHEFDSESIKKQNFTIPTSILDAHRQFIWGFSLSKFKEKPWIGYGPDASNFIEGGQQVIGSKYTGTMKFIPSHPHNFLVELLLETGILGTLSFIIFILILNYRIFSKANILDRSFLIFFNGYYWGASLVNFSYWQAWWQGSYFLILCLLASKIIKLSQDNGEINLKKI